MNALIMRCSADSCKRLDHAKALDVPISLCPNGSSCCDSTHSFARLEPRSRTACTNQCDRVVGATTSPPGCLPFFNVAPTVTTVDQRNGDSQYNATQLKFQKRTNVGLTLLAAYTWSKTIDNVSNIVYPYNDQLNRALSKALDIPQNLSVSYIYDLPFGNGRKWLTNSSGLARQLITGWSASGITTYQSGTPLQITVSPNLLGNDGGSNPANLTCNSVSMPKQVSGWFNMSCFSAPPKFTFGDSGVGHVSVWESGIGISPLPSQFCFPKAGGSSSRPIFLTCSIILIFPTQMSHWEHRASA